jgi:hypothetical protein
MKPAECSCGRAAREGDLHVSNIEQSMDVNVPVSTAYSQWMQFEEFARCMEGVVDVRQLENAGDAVDVARACIRGDLDRCINAPHS